MKAEERFSGGFFFEECSLKGPLLKGNFLEGGTLRRLFEGRFSREAPLMRLKSEGVWREAFDGGS